MFVSMYFGIIFMLFWCYFSVILVLKILGGVVKTLGWSKLCVDQNYLGQNFGWSKLWVVNPLTNKKRMNFFSLENNPCNYANVTLSQIKFKPVRNINLSKN